MAILNENEARSLMKKALAYSKAEECEINLYGSDTGNLRYARNTVSTSGNVSQTGMVISSAFGKKQGITTLNEFDEASLEKAVRLSEELARLAPENPEFVSYLGPQTYAPPAKMFVQSTADITPKQRTDMVQQSLQIAKDNKLTAAGYLENSASFNSMMNSHGLFAYNTGTDVNFSVTLRTEDGKGSGYSARDFNDLAKLDAPNLTKIASKKATASATAKAIEPGKYTVILEPTAAAELLGNMYYNLDARTADEGRSFLSKKGGGTKLGEKMLDERVTIYSDPSHPDLPNSTWSGDGRPQIKRTWIDKGVIKTLYNSRYWAKKQGTESVPSPDGIIMVGGTQTLDELIKSTEKGILVTRLWYIREVDPQTLLYTGLTRDGTFYIENGQIKFPVKNFRFNESPVIMLNNLEALGIPERIDGSLIPPMKIRDFTFTSLSDAV